MSDERVYVASGTLEVVEQQTSGVPALAVGLLRVSNVALFAAPSVFGVLWLLMSVVSAAIVGLALFALAGVTRVVGDKKLLRWARSI